MKIKVLLCVAALLLLPPAGLNAQPTNDLSPGLMRLGELVQQVQAKAGAGKTTEADFAAEIKALDTLKGQETNATVAAQILYMKGVLYLEVLDNAAKAGEILNQVAKEYPDTEFGKHAKEAAPQLEKQAAAKKIQDGLAAGVVFPDFAEQDLKGQPLSVGACKGKVVLVDFWATWCPPCRAELPNVIAVFKKHHDEGFEIVGVTLDNNRKTLEAFLKDHPDMTWPQFFDGNGDDSPNWSNRLVTKYGVQAIPFTLLVGRDGKIIGKGLRGEALETAVSEALAKK
jgi:thiol-disulfide isomerase/thioredoxin